MSGDVSGACGDHQELAQVDVAGDEVRRDLQKRLQVRASHVGIETFGRAPVLVDEPNIGIVARLMKVIVETIHSRPEWVRPRPRGPSPATGFGQAWRGRRLDSRVGSWTFSSGEMRGAGLWRLAKPSVL